jgi:hypothetical protein
MSIDLTVDGSYAHIMQFIYDLPHFPKILSVQGLSLHPAQGKKIDARMTVTAYVFDPSQDVTISQPLQRVLHQNGIPQTPIAGANVQAALQKTGFMSPEARAVGVARNDAAVADEQSKGQGILAPETPASAIPAKLTAPRPGEALSSEGQKASLLGEAGLNSANGQGGMR